MAAPYMTTPYQQENATFTIPSPARKCPSRKVYKEEDSVYLPPVKKIGEDDGSESDNSQEGLEIKRIYTSEGIFGDDLKQNLLDALHDSMCHAWNGWEQSNKYKSNDKAKYYVKLISLLQDTMEKVRKLK